MCNFLIFIFLPVCCIIAMPVLRTQVAEASVSSLNTATAALPFFIGGSDSGGRLVVPALYWTTAAPRSLFRGVILC